jgi:hypothetical protein
MRPPIPLPELRTFVRPFARLGALALGLCGCSALDTLSVGHQRNPYTLYLKPASVAVVSTDMRERYACVSGAPLMCQCMSRLGGDCECRC